MKGDNAMDIPVYLRIDDPATYRDVLCGQSYINAAVVRDAGNGQIREHVDIIAKETQKDQAVAAVAAGAVVLAIGGIVYLTSRVIQKHKMSKTIKQANELRETFQTYLHKATDGSMDIVTIDTLLQAFEKVKGNDEIIRLAFGSNEMYGLLNLLATYTRQMSEAYKCEEFKESPKQGAVILDFNKYLQMQREILSQAA